MQNINSSFLVKGINLSKATLNNANQTRKEQKIQKKKKPKIRNPNF